MKFEDAVEKAFTEQAGSSSAPKGNEQVESSSEKPQLNDNATKKTEEDNGQADNAQAPAGTEEEKVSSSEKSLDVWDGNPNSLPEFMQEHGKKVQRFITQRTTEAAELKRKVQEYEATLNSDELKAFRESQKQNKANPPASVESAIDTGAISQVEWEDALLDLTGQKASALIKRSIQMEVSKARKEAMEELNNEKEKESKVRSFQTEIADFAEVHPEIVEFHKMGIMKPMLKETLAAGGTLEEAFMKVKAVVDAIRGTERTKMNTSIDEKKNLTSVDKTPKAKADVVWVDNHDEALDRIIGDAMDKKPVSKVRIRTNKK